MIIPVFDVKDSRCVSGKGGNRSSYDSLSSVYGDDVVEVSRNLRDDSFEVVYVADLDMLEDCGDNSGIISEVNDVVSVMLDNACFDVSSIKKYENICTYSILATENIRSLDDVRQIFNLPLRNRIVFSIDIKNNDLLIKNNDIGLDDIISIVNEVKPDYTIILNLSQVGTKKTDDNDIIDYIIRKTPYTQHILGGGITNKSIAKYQKMGIDNFLVGTILHEGLLDKKYYPHKLRLSTTNGEKL